MMMKNNGESNTAIAEALDVPVAKVVARCTSLRKKGRKIAKGKAGNPSWKKDNVFLRKSLLTLKRRPLRVVFARQPKSQQRTPQFRN